ncbi:MAG: hypothetical protein ACFBRM_13760 [Pikeienuella sp.]
MILFGAFGADTFRLRSGDEILFSLTGDDTIQDFASTAPPENTGDDLVFGGFGDDVFQHTDGSDIFVGGFGDDAIELPFLLFTVSVRPILPITVIEPVLGEDRLILIGVEDVDIVLAG